MTSFNSAIGGNLPPISKEVKVAINGLTQITHDLAEHKSTYAESFNFNKTATEAVSILVGVNGNMAAAEYSEWVVSAMPVVERYIRVSVTYDGLRENQAFTHENLRRVQMEEFAIGSLMIPPILLVAPPLNQTLLEVLPTEIRDNVIKELHEQNDKRDFASEQFTLDDLSQSLKSEDETDAVLVVQKFLHRKNSSVLDKATLALAETISHLPTFNQLAKQERDAILIAAMDKVREELSRQVASILTQIDTLSSAAIIRRRKKEWEQKAYQADQEFYTFKQAEISENAPLIFEVSLALERLNRKWGTDLED